MNVRLESLDLATLVILEGRLDYGAAAGFQSRLEQCLAEAEKKRAGVIIKRAVDNGLTEVQVGRFPNLLFTDRGRAINQQEEGWEATLTGLPKELHEFWKKHLEARGYKVRYEIVDFPGGMPGDIGATLTWGDPSQVA